MTDRAIGETGASGVWRSIAVAFLWVMAAMLLGLIPFVAANEFQIFMAVIVMLNVIVVVGFNIVKGYAGQVTVAQVALYAIGAYSSALLTLQLGLSFWLSLPLSILVAAAFGFVIGAPSVRLAGAYLGLATLGLAEAVRLVLTATPAFGGASGIFGIEAPSFFGISLEDPARYFYLVLPIMLFGVFVSWNISRTGIGRAFRAIREDEMSAASSGIPVNRYKLLAFVISAAYAGCAGALFAHLQPRFISPDQFTLPQMVLFLLMLIMGGMGRLWGVILGAILVTVLEHVARSYYYYEYLIFGLTIVVMVAFLPQGIAGMVENALVVRRFRKLRESPADAA